MTQQHQHQQQQQSDWTYLEHSTTSTERIITATTTTILVPNTQPFLPTRGISVLSSPPQHSLINVISVQNNHLSQKEHQPQERIRSRTTPNMVLRQQQRPSYLFLRVLLFVTLLLTIMLMNDEGNHSMNHHHHISHNHQIWSTNAYTIAAIPDRHHRSCPSAISSYVSSTTTVPLSLRFLQRQPQQPQPRQGDRCTSWCLQASSTNNNNKKDTTINGSTPNQNSDDTSSKDTKQLEDEAKKMKVGELKQILESQGISTKTYIEKSEFIKAYIQLIMNGGSRNVNHDSSNSKTKSDTTSSKKTSTQSKSSEDNNNKKDPDYRDVVMYKMNGSDPRMLQGTMIDITIPKK